MSMTCGLSYDSPRGGGGGGGGGGGTLIFFSSYVGSGLDLPKSLHFRINLRC